VEAALAAAEEPEGRDEGRVLLPLPLTLPLLFFTLLLRLPLLGGRGAGEAEAVRFAAEPPAPVPVPLDEARSVFGRAVCDCSSGAPAFAAALEPICGAGSGASAEAELST